MVFHGTTIATNAIPYRRETAGHRHDHDRRLSRHPSHGRHQRPQHYSIMQDILAGPAAGQAPASQDGQGASRFRPRARCWSLPDEAGVRQAVRELKAAGVQAIAICFLSPTRPRTRRGLGRSCARSILSASPRPPSSVSPQFREFERFPTTAMNAFVGPKVRNYVTRLRPRSRPPASRPTCASWPPMAVWPRRPWFPSGPCSRCCRARPPA